MLNDSHIWPVGPVVDRVVVFASCNKEDNSAELQVQIEALSNNIEERDNMLNEMNTRMDSIGALLDSIEREEEGIVLNLEKGIRYNDYVSRLANIREFMNLSKIKLAEMEKMLANSSAPNKVYEKSSPITRRCWLMQSKTLFSCRKK